MTAAPTESPAGHTWDVSATKQIPFWRSVRVEARKMVDTRAGVWLLVMTALLVVAAAAVTLLVVLLNDLDLTAGDLTQIMAVPLSLLLPVFAITTVTGEWGHRTGLVTFTQQPRRTRVVLAKLTAVVLLALATIAVAVALGALVNLTYGALGDKPVVWNLTAGVSFWIIANQLLYFLMAFGFGMVLLSTPAAIAIYYVVALLLPFMVYGPIFGIVSWGPDVVPWLDLGFAVSPLLASGPDAPEITGRVYAQVAVTSFVWVMLPMGLGAWRVRRSEIK